MAGVRRIGWLLAGVGVLMGLLSVPFSDPWLLVVGAVPMGLGVLLATGLLRPGRALRLVAMGGFAIGVGLLAFGLYALTAGGYGVLAAAFVLPPGAAILAISLSVLRASRPSVARATVAPGEGAP